MGSGKWEVVNGKYGEAGSNIGERVFCAPRLKWASLRQKTRPLHESHSSLKAEALFVRAQYELSAIATQPHISKNISQVSILGFCQSAISTHQVVMNQPSAARIIRKVAAIVINIAATHEATVCFPLDGNILYNNV